MISDENRLVRCTTPSCGRLRSHVSNAVLNYRGRVGYTVGCRPVRATSRSAETRAVLTARGVLLAGGVWRWVCHGDITTLGGGMWECGTGVPGCRGVIRPNLGVSGER